LKILLTGFHFDKIGGLEIVSANIAAALVELGHDVKCASIHERRSFTRSGYSVVGLLPAGRIAGSLAARHMLLYPRWRMQELVGWADLVIACHCLTLPWIERSRLGSIRRPPVVAWLHGMEVWGDLGGRIAAQLRQADRLVAVSHYTSGTVTELLGPGYAPSVIHNTVDTDLFVPAEDPGAIERLSVLTVGRQEFGTENKGYEKLLEATALLCGRSPDLPVTLRIAGGGPLLESLKRRAADLGVGERVDFCGAVSRERLKQLYATCDLFAFPSRMAAVGGEVVGEGFGVVNIEAAACGRPVLTSTHGGCPETIVNGETGVLVDPTDSHAIAEGIERIFRLSTEQRDAMGRRGRMHVTRHFTHAMLSQKLGELLDDIVGGGSARSEHGNG